MPQGCGKQLIDFAQVTTLDLREDRLGHFDKGTRHIFSTHDQHPFGPPLNRSDVSYVFNSVSFVPYVPFCGPP